MVDGLCSWVSVAEKFSINFCGKCCSTDVCRSVVWLNCATIICHRLLLLLLLLVWSVCSYSQQQDKGNWEVDGDESG